MINLLSANKLADTNKGCPNCGSTVKTAIVSEMCNLLTDNTDLLTTCVNKDKLIAFQEAVVKVDEVGAEDVNLDDPCMYCPHNIITEYPGTFLQMKPSTTKFIEIHKCLDCETEYEVEEN